MSKINFVISIAVFAILLSITSAVKNKTRILEKKIFKIENKVSVLKKDVFETELEYTYLSSPKNITKKIKLLSILEYFPMDTSRIFLNFNEFLKQNKKISNLIKDESKEKK